MAVRTMQRAAPVVPVPLAPAVGWLEWLLPLALTALAYAVAGAIALVLGVPPSCASPLSPAAGIALASVLVYGWRMLGGVAVGALAVHRIRSCCNAHGCPCRASGLSKRRTRGAGPMRRAAAKRRRSLRRKATEPTTRRSRIEASPVPLPGAACAIRR